MVPLPVKIQSRKEIKVNEKVEYELFICETCSPIPCTIIRGKGGNLPILCKNNKKPEWIDPEKSGRKK